MLCNPTYNTSLRPITASIGGTRIVKDGIIGKTFVIAYDGSAGVVVNGSENIRQTLLIAKSCPSIIYARPNPNMRFVKNAPKRITFVTCQIMKLGILSL